MKHIALSMLLSKSTTIYHSLNELLIHSSLTFHPRIPSSLQPSLPPSLLPLHTPFYLPFFPSTHPSTFYHSTLHSTFPSSTSPLPFIHSFIHAISIPPLQARYYSGALPTQH